ncbi:MAG: Fic family protein [Candidatus Poribacteria bacterium]|nr:Fic family protein [Candidatus Poribacteria bacterium]MDD9975923.1 Fic family protein [Candidatus Poribacteria bacterium]MDE0325231.1 Fic family protein [Candidatus Poribacteria bacterium]
MPQFNPNLPWNDLPELPPAVDLESRDILKACISAMTELARANALVKQLPSEEVLINTLPLQEARRSSEIENIVTTNDDLYRAMASDRNQVDSNTKEVLRYREALWDGVNHIREGSTLDIQLFEQICSRILDEEMKVRNGAVVIENRATQKLIYRPPTGYGNLIRLLINLGRFINDRDDGFQPLVKMAIMHYQFEAIHPFMDGNGRTGRILNILYLVHQGLLDVPILYLSRFFIQNRDEYYRYLREVTENGNWQQWILYILKAVEQTSRDTADKIEAINRLINNVITTARDKTKAVEREGFVDLLFKWPYCKISIVEEELRCSRLTATKYLNEVTALGLLERLRFGREYYYINKNLIDLLSIDTVEESLRR